MREIPDIINKVIVFLFNCCKVDIGVTVHSILLKKVKDKKECSRV